MASQTMRNMIELSEVQLKLALCFIFEDPLIVPNIQLTPKP